MREMSAPDLLSAWERTLGQPPAGQALALLSAAHPEIGMDALSALTIGQRNRRLLALRERWFGPRVTAVATCPRCDRPVELTFLISDLGGGPSPVNAIEDAPPPSVLIEAHGYRVECRVPTSLDLASLAAVEESREAGVALLRRCVRSIEPAGASGDQDREFVDPARLPASVVEAVAEGLSAADPHADAVLALRCPECAHAWQAPFDIAAYLVAELHGWARRLLHEVHDLARAYGWSEADILAMTPVRRRAYLELAGLG
jgi:hypothetical protein